jgi:hypothetical protein
MPDTARSVETPFPWWRCGAAWVLAGALGVAVLASGSFAAVAVITGDPDVVTVPRAQRAQAAVQPDAPALQGRNHAATPRP